VTQGEPKPSATVVLIRDGKSNIEILLLQRNARREGGAGLWVFPGGKIEPRDVAGSPDDPESRARRAAVRETREEAGLEIGGSRLVTISRWITPEIAPRRFDTWFFLGTVGRHEVVRVDGSEMSAHRWLSPKDALEAHRGGEIRLAPPTFVTVTWLADYSRSADAVGALGRGPILTFRPRICPIPDGACILYPGDAGYEAGDVERPGPRHRLWSLASGYRYERSP
jgi:8-oxo-dGTP pyrophosphatase MutT (NUDIX family)